MKELKIGETISVKCIEDDGRDEWCEKCVFHTDEPYGRCGCAPSGIDFPCYPTARSDNKSVHFEFAN